MPAATENRGRGWGFQFGNRARCLVAERHVSELFRLWHKHTTCGPFVLAHIQAVASWVGHHPIHDTLDPEQGGDSPGDVMTSIRL